MDRNLNTLIDNLDETWTTLLNNNELERVNTGLTIATNKLIGLPVFPKPENTFRAFSYCNPKDIKVVIIGQDCYHGDTQAIGLCFGVNEGTTNPPSLRNICKELRNDLDIIITDSSLESWAQQGVLLLNSALTVHKSLPGSHLKIWCHYTDLIIKQFSDNTDNVCFMLWGNYAKSKSKLISKENGHYILEASHPSPLSANRGGWFGAKHFSKVNTYLQQYKKTTIDW